MRIITTIVILANNSRHDTTPSLLTYPLSSQITIHTSKRPRLSTPEPEKETILSKVLSAAYQSIDELIQDLNDVKKSILTSHMPRQDKKTYEINQKNFVIITDVLVEAGRNFDYGTSIKAEEDEKVDSSTIISLRAQIDKGPHQLFSGLQNSETLVKIDGQSLPNGFELTQATVLDVSEFSTSESRTIGEVFRPHRNTRQLEPPRSTKYEGRTLTFKQFDGGRTNKSDWRNTTVTTGSCLAYRDGSENSVPSKLGLVRNPGIQFSQGSSSFGASYTSFAPTTDDTITTIPSQEMIFFNWSKNSQSQQVDNSDNPTVDEFLDVVDSFVPIQSTEEENPADETDKVLEEISELLETLASHQRIRQLEGRTTESVTKPSSAESGVYELLHSQLSILISSLPPFAVAKLDGSQLRDLNVSTSIPVKPIEFTGTAQADDFTLRRFKTNQIPATRPTQPTPYRPPYQASNNMAYNASATTYNSLQRPVYTPRAPSIPNYQTPRPSISRPNYGQQSYSAQTNPQQFQRSVQNGYYGTTPSPYTQRPTQPGYQQRAQDANLARSNSPQKPIINGTPAANYRPYQQPALTPAQQYATMDQRAIMERVKTQQSA